MNQIVPGAWIANPRQLPDIHDPHLNWSVSTDRYTCPDYAAQERDAIWMKVWQIVGNSLNPCHSR